MAPKYKIIYFNVKALGEPIRYILSHAGEEFQDVRVEVEKWPSQKDDTPFGKMPILEVDGKRTHQSASICRYLGQELGLGGETSWENQEIDCTVDTVVDLRIAIVNATYGDEFTEKMEERKAKLVKETVPFYLSRLNEQVKNNGGYFVNNKVKVESDRDSRQQ
ncbi:Putative glutathione s-transferase [Gryllus bimaculatus]|nr:Putative glutathione s-transferase [Gryllus bimaculatus]